MHDYFNYATLAMSPHSDAQSQAIAATVDSWQERGGDPDVVGRLVRRALAGDADDAVLQEIHDNAIARDMKETLRKLKAAKFVRENPDEVCPAKWQEGEKTLKPSLDLVGKI